MIKKKTIAIKWKRLKIISIFTLMICLESAYFAKTEKFLLKIQWDP